MADTACQKSLLTYGISHDTAARQDLLPVMVLEADANAGIRQAAADRLRQIKETIRRELSRRDLSASSVAARHGITARYLRLLFEREGMTFSAFLLDQRLQLARRLLSDECNRRAKISAIAFDCGFNDLSWFNRKFRERFAMTPSAMRNGARTQR